MLTLILSILGNASFGLTVKAADRRSCNLLAVGFVNYVVATGIYAVVTSGRPPAGSATVFLGIIGGVFFATAFLMLTYVLRTRGISITAAVLQLTVLFPVLAGILVWKEHVGMAQLIGIGLSLLALPLMSVDRSGPFRVTITGLRFTTGLFIVGGFCQLTMHSFHYLGAPIERGHLFLYIFGTAVLISGFWWLLMERRMTTRDLLFGIVLGMVNCVGGYMLVSSMQTFPGMVAFPIASAMTLLLTTLVAWHFWNERLGWHAGLGMAIALVAVVCINTAR